MIDDSITKQTLTFNYFSSMMMQSQISQKTE